MATVSLGTAPANSNFPDGFSQGVTIRGIPVLNTYSGRVFWLNSNNPTASDSNKGTFERPFLTLQGVMTAAAAGGKAPQAGRGDTIMVGAGHAETISTATALTCSISGLNIIGLGTGAMRPTWTLSTAATATINVTAANISFINCLFVANFANVAACFTLTTANEFRLDGCEFRDTTSILNFVNIVSTDTTSNDANGLSILNCAFNGLGAASNTTVIGMNGTNSRLYVMNNYITHTATSQAGGMIIAAGKVVTGMQWVGNTHNLTGAAAGVGEVISTNQTTNTGLIAGNFTQSLATTPIFATASSGFVYNQNYHSDTADTSGYLVPAADS